MKQYKIKIYDKDWTVLKVLTNIDARVLNFSEKLNDSGSGSFAVSKDSIHISKSLFQKYNKVQFLRFDGSNFVIAWAGVIEAVIEQENEYLVGCVSLIDIFEKRLTSANQILNGNAGVDCLTLLTNTNLDDDSGISEGVTDYITTNDLEANEKSIISVWKDIAKKEGGEFKINYNDNTLDFLINIGSDKSSTVKFVYNDFAQELSNIEFANVEEMGKYIYNRVIGKAKVGNTSLTSTQEDIDSIEKYGLHERVESFDNVNSQAELDSITLKYLNTFREEIDNPEIKILPKQEKVNIKGISKTVGLDLSDIQIGDIILLRIKTNYNEVNQNRKIISVDVRVDEIGNEDIRLKLSDVDNFQDIEEIEKNLLKGEEAEKNRQIINNRVYGN